MILKEQTVLVSIIISAYNAEKYIERAIDSILNQSYPNWELLIADDGSTDNTKVLIDLYDDKRIKKSHNKSNLGKVKTVNRLYAKVHTNSEFITIHDADDWSEAKRFEITLNYFRNHPNVIAVGCHTNHWNERAEIIGGKKYSYDKEVFLKTMEKYVQFNSASLFFRKNKLFRKELYRPFFDGIVSEDNDLILHLIENGDLDIIQQSLYNYFIDFNSYSRKLENPMKVFSNKIALFLYRQRIKNGSDGIMNKSLSEELKNFIKLQLEPYEEDSSLIFRKEAELRMYYKLYRGALISSFHAILEKPFNLVNYRLAFYIFRKANFKLFF